MSGRKRSDPKLASLRLKKTLNLHPERVADAAFRQSDFFDPRDLLQVKYEMIRKVRIDKSPAGDTAKSFGLSRPSFYKAHSSFEQEGLAGLLPGKRGPHDAHKLTPDVMRFVSKARASHVAISHAELAASVKERFKIQVHPRSIERALHRKEKKRQ